MQLIVDDSKKAMIHSINTFSVCACVPHCCPPAACLGPRPNVHPWSASCPPDDDGCPSLLLQEVAKEMAKKRAAAAKASSSSSKHSSATKKKSSDSGSRSSRPKAG